ncbi:putative CTL-like protein [Polypedilum vanderplanki]|uniref:Choline transporter-like protein n=1 Tax=Polypedilum vanderplanki TaxID=319348 RepID=A0A9J6BTA8_POLVA|nr:putative CTL-like protein [Polypedilum vanderplanki]
MWNSQDHDVPGERKCTNLSSLFFCGGFVVIMLILVGYSGFYGDLNRLTKGYDDCGNICGVNNPKNKFDQCGMHDMTLKPKVLVETKIINYNETVSHFTCVEKCPNDYSEIFNRCWKKSKNAEGEVEGDEIGTVFQQIAQDLINLWPQIGLVCLVAFVFSYILLLLFRYAIEYVIWIIYISFIIVFAIGSIVFWYLFAVAGGEEKSGLLVGAIMFTLVTILCSVLLYWFRRRIKLVAELFKEASRALIDVPQILFEPISTFISLLLAFVAFVYFTIVIQTAGKLEEKRALDGQFQATYEQDAGMGIGAILNFIAFLWFTQFIFGCQHFVISGTISKWYFARDKTKLNSPVITTFSHLLNFHLGSICLGSMVITIVKILRMIFKAIENQSRESGSPIVQCIACFCGWIIQQLEELLKYLVRNAYIIVAKEGTPLYQSGKRAFHLLFENLMDVIALNQFGDIVLIVGRLFVVGIAGLIGYEIMNKPHINVLIVPLLISILFAFLIAHCFISVFEMTVDTIFICFCIDCEENDGVTKQHYMSPGLKKIMSELKETAGGQFNWGNMNNSVESGHLMGGNQPQPPYPINQPPYPTH